MKKTIKRLFIILTVMLVGLVNLFAAAPAINSKYG